MKSLGSREGLSLLQKLSDPLSCLFTDLLALSSVVAHFALLWLLTRQVTCCFSLLQRSVVLDVTLGTLLLTVGLEAIKSLIEWASDRPVTHGRNRWKAFLHTGLNWSVLSERSLERLLLATERVRAFLYSESTVVIQDVSVSTAAVLSIDNNVGVDWVSCGPIHS